MRLKGKRAVVTGAGRGIGAAIARSFAAEGATVVIVARSSQDLEGVARIIHDDGIGSAHVAVADAGDDDSMSSLAESIRSIVGVPDILVPNAGHYLAGRFDDIALADFRAVMEVNYFGLLRTIKPFTGEMAARGSGSIVVIASTAGRQGSAFQTPYNASKHAVVGLVRSLALELAPSAVRVNAVAPGYVKTGMLGSAVDTFAEILDLPKDAVMPQLIARRVPIGREIDPHEIASLAVYLASDESRSVIGQVMHVDGGMVVA